MQNDPNIQELGSMQMSCPTHGSFTSTGRKLSLGRLTREMWSTCPQCKAHNATQTCLASAQQAASVEQGRLATLLQQAAIPKRFLASSFDNFETTTDEQAKVLAKCVRYAENFEHHLDRGTGLLLAGTPGTGNSHLASAILQAIMPTHVGAYTKMMDLVYLLRDGYQHVKQSMLALSQSTRLEALHG